MLYALKFDVLLLVLVVAIPLAAISFVGVFSYRLDWLVALVAGISLVLLQEFSSWRQGVVRRGLSYRHVFAAVYLYEFRNIAIAVLAFFVIPLVDCVLFFGSSYFGLVLVFVFVLSMELHLRLRYGSHAVDDYIYELVKVSVLVLSLIAVMWGLSWVVFLQAYFYLYFDHLVVGSILLASAWLVFHFWDARSSSIPRAARRAQFDVLIVISVVFSGLGVLLKTVIQEEGALFICYAIFYCLAVAAVEVVNIIGCPISLGPVD
ncbi:hypothetical protein [Bradyrhizobium sp. SZCCHNRI3043]|uniref:hypothetical protein n=1 Tax=Bradyrhizobium sp. SZCCHNRI3043 TaxID=3057292 RepID=UPI0028EA788D|nr:hypothetical protein [Bradyrhizobium sp. SZCCHNRI3043]